MRRFRGVPVAAAVVVLALSGCTARVQPDESEPPSPFADCAALTGPAPVEASSSAGPSSAGSVPAGSSSAGSSAGSAAGSSAGSARPESRSVSAKLPDVVLPCFTGGDEVRMPEIRTPTVINIWASFCEPCRDELPVMQGLADRAGGRFTVLGVDSGDRRSAAASFAADHGVSFPTLFDPDRRFSSALGQATLPVTVFVGPDGQAYVHRDAVDVDELIGLMREHTGVTVTR